MLRVDVACMLLMWLVGRFLELFCGIDLLRSRGVFKRDPRAKTSVWDWLSHWITIFIHIIFSLFFFFKPVLTNWQPVMCFLTSELQICTLIWAVISVSWFTVQQRNVISSRHALISLFFCLWQRTTMPTLSSAYQAVIGSVRGSRRQWARQQTSLNCWTSQRCGQRFKLQSIQANF